MERDYGTLLSPPFVDNMALDYFLFSYRFVGGIFFLLSKRQHCWSVKGAKPFHKGR